MLSKYSLVIDPARFSRMKSVAVFVGVSSVLLAFTSKTRGVIYEDAASLPYLTGYDYIVVGGTLLISCERENSLTSFVQEELQVQLLPTVSVKTSSSTYYCSKAALRTSYWCSKVESIYK